MSHVDVAMLTLTRHGINNHDKLNNNSDNNHNSTDNNDEGEGIKEGPSRRREMRAGARDADALRALGAFFLFFFSYYRYTNEYL